MRPGGRRELLPANGALTPQSPADCLDLYEMIRDDMRTRVVGETHGGAIRRLALLGVRHLRGEPLLRGLIIGERGSGKTTLCRALADALGLPTVTLPVSMLVEEGWQGHDLSDWLDSAYSRIRLEHGAVDPLEALSTAVIVLDEFDHVRLPGRLGTAPTREHQEGRQRALTQVVGDGAVPLAAGVWESRRALVVACGTFPELNAGPVSSASLGDWGLIAELASRLACGTVVRMERLSAADLVWVLLHHLEASDAAYEAFGYTLEVALPALTYLADVIASGRHDADIRSALGWIRAAADAGLMRLVERRAPAGTRYVLAPDDIVIPEPSRGAWRE